jgi:cytochrome b
MKSKNCNTVFQQWLAAYATHLDQVMKGCQGRRSAETSKNPLGAEPEVVHK